MTSTFYHHLTETALHGNRLSLEDCSRVLTDPNLELLPLLDAAYQVRKTYYDNTVSIHIINNAKNGNCPEDCHYCAQSKPSEADIVDYPMKSDDEILAEAQSAHESGAYRYCMVFAGRGPSKGRVARLCRLISTIKERYPIQVCLSPGLIDEQDAVCLKMAGLDRLNHNLNTSESFYSEICTTHTYQDRVNTLAFAQKAGLETCSGMIVGLGETPEDVVEVLTTLRDKETPSIPINFHIPIEGTPLTQKKGTESPLTSHYCLRVLCLARFLNPKAEIRVAAGREIHLRSLQVMALYPANSLFMDGYLNTTGSNENATLTMIKDAGFTINSNFSVDDILAQNEGTSSSPDRVILKQEKELRPTRI